MFCYFNIKDIFVLNYCSRSKTGAYATFEFYPLYSTLSPDDIPDDGDIMYPRG